MPRLVDWEALVADFESFLVEDGRSSHGTDFLTRKLAELRSKHRIEESEDAAVLRRFSAHLSDTFFGLVPRPSVTTDPLDASDPTGTPAAMDGGTPPDQSPTEGASPCLTHRQRPLTPHLPPDSLRDSEQATMVLPRPVPATTC